MSQTSGARSIKWKLIELIAKGKDPRPTYPNEKGIRRFPLMFYKKNSTRMNDNPHLSTY